MKKKPTTINLDEDIYDHIQENERIISFSEWVHNAYRKEFMKMESESNLLDWHLKEAEKCKARIRQLLAEDETPILPENLDKWIRTEGVRRINNKASVEWVLKYFNNEFNQKLSLRQFKILLAKVKK